MVESRSVVRIRSGVDNAGGAPDEWNRVSLLPASRSRLLCRVCHHLRFSFFLLVFRVGVSGCCGLDWHPSLAV